MKQEGSRYNRGQYPRAVRSRRVTHTFFSPENLSDRPARIASAMPFLYNLVLTRLQSYKVSASGHLGEGTDITTDIDLDGCLTDDKGGWEDLSAAHASTALRDSESGIGQGLFPVTDEQGRSQSQGQLDGLTHESGSLGTAIRDTDELVYLGTDSEPDVDPDAVSDSKVDTNANSDSDSESDGGVSELAGLELAEGFELVAKSKARASTKGKVESVSGLGHVWSTILRKSRSSDCFLSAWVVN